MEGLAPMSKDQTLISLLNSHDICLLTETMKRELKVQYIGFLGFLLDQA